MSLARKFGSKLMEFAWNQAFNIRFNALHPTFFFFWSFLVPGFFLRFFYRFLLEVEGGEGEEILCKTLSRF